VIAAQRRVTITWHVTAFNNSNMMFTSTTTSSAVSSRDSSITSSIQVSCVNCIVESSADVCGVQLSLLSSVMRVKRVYDGAMQS
jgi:hypothetical protein